VIHATAIVDPGARLGEAVEVGPYSIIGPDVEVGDATRIGAHVVLSGPTRIGRENRIYPFCSLGEAPQDKKYAGEPTELVIGDRNTIREYCTLNRGTLQDAGVTRVGDDNWIMAYVHIAHDCRVGNHTIFANGASLAGHVDVEDHAILGGFTLVHQFCRIGAHCITALGSAIVKDVPPFVTVSGNFAAPHGLNMEGLRRRGFDDESLRLLRRAYKIVYKQGLTLEQAKAELRPLAQESAHVGTLLAFLEGSTRGIVR
jgi:UDP-N-acetylglucosamine acyltransferase